MKDGDTFGDLVNGCRQLGMNVVARTDPHGCHRDVYDAHPDWIAVDAHGNKRRHWADPDFWITCALVPFNFDFMTHVTDEIVSLYAVDGAFSDRWAEHCRRNFRDFLREAPRIHCLAAEAAVRAMAIVLLIVMMFSFFICETE